MQNRDWYRGDHPKTCNCPECLKGQTPYSTAGRPCPPPVREREPIESLSEEDLKNLYNVVLVEGLEKFLPDLLFQIRIWRNLEILLEKIKRLQMTSLIRHIQGFFLRGIGSLALVTSPFSLITGRMG